ncbi:hypothetical protein K488DRAFT_51316 [Vararia minispora EC-137]|uniref:Uncharacterized protein n=1 Tax=Vararia minispora EC-137 TaxID=1314806 RepID=A0ACB8QJF6_9AGAM|nr:hypothetical protein K488DRAFT_51316 [Vararia minispora EC-137]
MNGFLASVQHDELTATVLSVVESLSPRRKACLLLEHALALIESGRYGHEVEEYLDVYFRTPDLPADDVAKALLARGKARKDAAQLLLMRAELDFRSASSVDPSNREIQAQLRRDRLIHSSVAPASQRAPPEVWDRIASFIPRYFLRTWLTVSSFYRDIASRHLFRTLDLYISEDMETNHRTMDVLDRVKADPIFARRVKALRLHWSHENGEMLEVMSRILRTALREFNALREFEWIGYPELQNETVKALLQSHPNLAHVGSVGWHFDAAGVSAFRHLKRFTLRAEDDDGEADMAEVRAVLDANARTLTHLTLGAYLARPHSWDAAFCSATILNLTRLELVDTRITHAVLSRVTCAQRLVDLTLHGTLDAPQAAAVVFGADSDINGEHILLPLLSSVRIVLVGHDEDLSLYRAFVHFLRHRSHLRRLDLGNCPAELVLALLPELTGLRVLRVRIANLSDRAVDSLVAALPRMMHAIHLSSVVSLRSLSEYAAHFARFPFLSMLHLHGGARRRLQAAAMSEKEAAAQTELWLGSARRSAAAVPSLDFVGWHGEHYVVSRGPRGLMELKELPVRRRLDCGKGVDLGSEDANWMERKDVPMDYEMSGLEV